MVDAESGFCSPSCGGKAISDAVTNLDGAVSGAIAPVFLNGWLGEGYDVDAVDENSVPNFCGYSCTLLYPLSNASCTSCTVDDGCTALTCSEGFLDTDGDISNGCEAEADPSSTCAAGSPTFAL